MRFYNLLPDSSFFPKASINDNADLGYGHPYYPASLSCLEFPPEEPYMPTLVVHEDAELTDFLTEGFFGGRGYIVSKKVRSLLENFKLLPHRYYPMSIEHRGKILYGEYFWLQLVDDGNIFIDFEHSEFCITELGNVLRYIKLDNFEHIQATRKTLKVIQQVNYHKLTLNDTYLMYEYDMFYFYYLSYQNVTITERLKEAFESHSVSGIGRFLERNIYMPKWS